MPCVFKNLASKWNSINYTHLSLHANDPFYIYAKTVNHKHNDQFYKSVDHKLLKMVSLRKYVSK